MLCFRYRGYGHSSRVYSTSPPYLGSNVNFPWRPTKGSVFLPLDLEARACLLDALSSEVVQIFTLNDRPISPVQLVKDLKAINQIGIGTLVLMKRLVFNFIPE